VWIRDIAAASDNSNIKKLEQGVQVFGFEKFITKKQILKHRSLEVISDEWLITDNILIECKMRQVEKNTHAIFLIDFVCVLTNTSNINH
jgi:hypothetical protein